MSLPGARRLTSVAATIAVGVAALSASPEERQADWVGAVRPISSPAGAQSAQPQLRSSARGVLLSWVERNGTTATLKYAERHGGRWSEAKAVASGDNWFVNWADVPSVMRMDNGTLVAHWLQKSGASTYAYDVRLSHSAADGRTWTPSTTPHHDGTQTEHGFASLVEIPGRGPGVVWLDGRQTATSGGHQGGHSTPSAAMTLRFATFNGAWTQVSDMPIDQRQDGSAVASWIELKEGRAAFMVRKLAPAGARSLPVEVATLEGSRTSGYPRLASSGDELLFAWTDTAGGSTVVRTAVATLLRRTLE
jgi:hypothetical protein